MSSANQLFLLADHVKLSLLERQRAQALDLDSDSQDGHLSRSLEQFRDGLAALRDEAGRLAGVGDKRYAHDGPFRPRPHRGILLDACPLQRRTSLPCEG